MTRSHTGTGTDAARNPGMSGVDAIVGHQQPPNPYAAKPELGEKLRSAFRVAYE